MLLDIGLICLTLFLILHRYVTKNFDHWKKQGVPHINGHFPYGSHIELLTQSKHFYVLVKENYERFKNEDFHGMFVWEASVGCVELGFDTEHHGKGFQSFCRPELCQSKYDE